MYVDTTKLYTERDTQFAYILVCLTGRDNTGM